jgi:hypothetical protein
MVWITVTTMSPHQIDLILSTVPSLCIENATLNFGGYSREIKFLCTITCTLSDLATKQPGHKATWPPRQDNALIHHQPPSTTMRQPKRTQSAYNEGDISRALSAIDPGIFSSVRRAAAAYSIPRSTLQNRRAGMASKRDCTPKSKKLTKQEEAAIVQHILELGERRFPPTLDGVREMANELLAQRDAGIVDRQADGNAQAKRRCRRSGRIGHNSRTYSRDARESAD